MMAWEAHISTVYCMHARIARCCIACPWKGFCAFLQKVFDDDKLYDDVLQ